MKYQKTMEELKNTPKNGYNVVSFFSGGGGSSMGYMLSGYTIKAANDFDQPAVDAYRLNFPDTPVIHKSIREINGEEVLKLIGLEKYELDVLDGSPPCTVFSAQGAREKYWGVEKQYGDIAQREDDLFFEYLRIVEEIMPKVFIAENVRGMTMGNAKKYVDEILKKADSIGYNTEMKLLNAADFNTPQNRERVIFIGVRKDLGIKPAYPIPTGKIITTKEAIGELIDDGTDAKELSANRIAALEEMGFDTSDADLRAYKEKFGKTLYRSDFIRNYWDTPCRTIVAQNRPPHPKRNRSLSLLEGCRIQSFPDDYKFNDSPRKNWARIGRSVPPNLMAAVSKAVQTEILDKAPKLTKAETEAILSTYVYEYTVGIE